MTSSLRSKHSCHLAMPVAISFYTRLKIAWLEGPPTHPLAPPTSHSMLADVNGDRHRLVNPLNLASQQTQDCISSCCFSTPQR